MNGGPLDRLRASVSGCRSGVIPVVSASRRSMVRTAWLMSASRWALDRKPRHDLVEQVARAFSMFGRDLDHGLETELVELERATARPPIVHLVHRQDHRNVCAAERRCNFLVSRDQALPPI